MIEGASLSNRTDESLRQRVDQLTAMTRINRELNTTLEWKYLLQVVYDESLRIAHADCGSMLFSLTDRDLMAMPKVIFHLGDEPSEALLPIERGSGKMERRSWWRISPRASMNRLTKAFALHWSCRLPIRKNLPV